MSFLENNSDNSLECIIVGHEKKLLAEGLELRHGKLSLIETHQCHPKNWPLSRKIYDTGIMFLLELVTTMVSNTGSLSAFAAHEELRISREQALAAFTTTYLVAQAIGSIVISPYTECYGRRSTYIASATVFAITTAVVGFSQGLAPILLGRLMSGLASAVPTTVLGGSIEDIWDIKARIWVIDLWVLHAIIGVAVAPAYAVAIASSLGWKDHLNKNYAQLALSLPDDDLTPSLVDFAKNRVKKPLVLLCTQPLLLVVTVMSASVYGFAYLLTEELPRIYATFGFNELQSSFVYMALCGGAVLALIMRLQDARVVKKRDLQNQALIPEDKLTGFYVAAPLQAIAFWVFAWSIAPLGYHQTPAISIITIIPIGFALNEFDHVLLGYIVDMYTEDASSACAPLGALRAILSAVMPLAGLKMFERLDNNLAASVIAIIATVYCAFAAVFYCYGIKLRMASLRKKNALG
ncbi:uncharacterized protein PV09_03531 [Verruconis gallopava]|uniref:Major facilitator superfamily (MFS) profile domain-containing protein n=1 Tax=Verruconis gallopava TaxID=253628 RepID=A0A0D1YY90_9PEZI|nr:uncharacterized protein PV09_03531 [Verruconis gallopava]KIW05667.1 hypothetical protein PV09_03531 [Verruconis gallopava]